MTRNEPLSAISSEVCLGALVVLFVMPVAALGAPRPGGLAVFGAVALLPAFMFLIGFCAAEAPQPATRMARMLLVAGAAALACVASAMATRQGWREGLAHAAPVLQILVLPPLYLVLMRPLRAAPAAYILFLALLCHIVGIVFGGKAGFVLTLAPYFALGTLAARHRAKFGSLLDAQPEFAAASGPFVLALAVFVCARAPGATALASVGPGALLVGLAAGPAALASAGALVATPFAGQFARLGRAAPALAIAWLPLFHFLVAIMSHGAAPATASLILLSVASLLIALVAADAISDARSAAVDAGGETATASR